MPADAEGREGLLPGVLLGTSIFRFPLPRIKGNNLLFLVPYSKTALSFQPARGLTEGRQRPLVTICHDLTIIVEEQPTVLTRRNRHRENLIENNLVYL